MNEVPRRDHDWAIRILERWTATWPVGKNSRKKKEKTGLLFGGESHRLDEGQRLASVPSRVFNFFRSIRLFWLVVFLLVVSSHSVHAAGTLFRCVTLTSGCLDPSVRLSYPRTSIEPDARDRIGEQHAEFHRWSSFGAHNYESIVFWYVNIPLRRWNKIESSGNDTFCSGMSSWIHDESSRAEFQYVLSFFLFVDVFFFN